MKYILSLDAGTGSVRAIIFDKVGNQIIESQREYTHKVNPKYQGSIDFDIENNWKLICECIKDVLKQVSPNDILAISTTSMREAFVLYDENKKPIWACSNVDARAYQETIDLRKNKDLESGTIIGEVNNKASKETGLKEGTKIVMGGGDAQLGTIGVGAVNEKDTVVLGGTFWQQEVNMKNPIIDKEARIRINCSSVSDLWQAEGIAFYPGLVARWFRDAFCEDLKEVAKKNNTNAYKLLSNKAKDIPSGCYGIIPIFSDRMNYISWKHAAPSFINMTIDHNKTNRYSLFKSIMENAAIVSYNNIKTIENFSNINIDYLTFAGGAANDPVWCQILADVLQLEVRTTKVKEATALGAAICAYVGINLYKDFYEAANVAVKKDTIYYPNKNNFETYNNLINKFNDVYKIQLELADKNLTTHMWKAPGE